MPSPQVQHDLQVTRGLTGHLPPEQLGSDIEELCTAYPHKMPFLYVAYSAHRPALQTGKQCSPY